MLENSKIKNMTITFLNPKSTSSHCLQNPKILYSQWCETEHILEPETSTFDIFPS